MCDNEAAQDKEKSDEEPPVSHEGKVVKMSEQWQM